MKWNNSRKGKIFCKKLGDMNYLPYFCSEEIEYLKIMATMALERETNIYWNLIKGAGNEVKLSLIKRLSDAVLPAVARTKSRKSKFTADEFAGIWSDDDYMNAEDMVKAIRDGRHVDSSRNTILL